MSGRTTSLLKETGKLLIIFLAVFAIFYLSRDLRINNPQAITFEDEGVLFIEERIGLNEFIDKLQNIGAEFDPIEIQWVSSLLGWRNFNPGRYEFSDSYRYEDLLSKVALGLQDHTRVIIHPGISIERLANSLGRQFLADSADFAEIFSDSSSLIMETGYQPESLFARMLPDTYNFYWTTDPARVIQRIYNEFTQRVSQQYLEELEDHQLSLEEIITLASIVEWEARDSEEKPRISGLYWNRLNRNMRLQADPTVIYALGEHRRLLFDDYSLDHPYNTYVIDGLPPGPITNPDLNSILSVLNPEEHDYLYMVASPQGGHVFSRTFQEHRVASAEWRRWIQEQFRIRDELDRMENAGESTIPQ